MPQTDKASLAILPGLMIVIIQMTPLSLMRGTNTLTTKVNILYVVLFSQ